MDSPILDQLDPDLDSPILDPLDLDSHFLADPDPGYHFKGVNMEIFHIIDQKSHQPWYFFTVN